MRTVAIISNIYFLFYILSQSRNLGKYLWNILLMGEVTLSLSVVYLLSLCKLAYIDFGLLQLMVTRILTLSLLLKLIKEKAPGFEDADIKQL